MKWNIDPEIFRYGTLSVRYYSLMFVIGFTTMGPFVRKLFAKYGRNPELVSTLTTYVILGMVIGARLVHCLFYQPDYFLSHPFDILKVWQGGLASHGGYLGVLIAIWLFARKNEGLTFFWIIDIMAGPCLIIGGLIRLGNFFNSEIYGDITTVPWAIVFERIDLHPRHPAQLYESLGYFLIGVILIQLCHKKFLVWKQGTIYSLALIMSFTFRFFIEFVKLDESPLTASMPINMGQLLSLAFVLFASIQLMMIQKFK